MTLPELEACIQVALADPQCSSRSIARRLMREYGGDMLPSLREALQAGSCTCWGVFGHNPKCDAGHKMSRVTIQRDGYGQALWVRNDWDEV